MSVEAPKPAPKGALRRLGQRIEQYVFPPISDEENEAQMKRLGIPPDLEGGLNPLWILSIFVDGLLNFSYDVEQARYDKAVKGRADEASIPTEKVTTQTAAALGNLKDTMKEIKNNLHFR